MPMKPKTLMPAQLAEVETLASVLNAAQMADYFGIGRTTLFAMLDRDEDVAERYRRGKARAIAQSLISKAREAKDEPVDGAGDRSRDGSGDGARRIGPMTMIDGI